MAKLVSKTYGEALFSLACEKDCVDSMVLEVKTVYHAFRENEDLIKLLNHPKIVREEKLSLIETIFKGRISDDLTGFLLLVVEKGRYNELDKIFEYFLDEVKEYKNIGVAYVTSAIPLNKAQKKEVEARLLKTTKYIALEMNYDTDQSLIGGLVIRIGDRVVDSSIRTKINNMAKELSKIQLTR